jgi:hypothetical protein
MAKIKIAKPGGNVLTDTDKELALTSDRNCLIENTSGTTDITTNGSGVGSAEITHSLGYQPAYWCFVRDPDSTTDWYPHQSGFPTLIASADTTKLYLDINQDASKTYRVFYQIFANQQDDGDADDNDNISGKLLVARSGENIPDVTDARKMQFMSGANVYKVDEDKSGSTTISITPPDIVTKTITHSLGYVPVSFVLDATNNEMLPVGSASNNVNYYVTSTTLVIELTDRGGS